VTSLRSDLKKCEAKLSATEGMSARFPCFGSLSGGLRALLSLLPLLSMNHAQITLAPLRSNELFGVLTSDISTLDLFCQLSKRLVGVKITLRLIEYQVSP